MKKFIISISLALFSAAVVFANVPLETEYQLNNWFGAQGAKVQLGTLIQRTRNVVVGRYDYAKQGGSSTGTIKLLTDLTNSRSYVTIPNNAIIQKVWVDRHTAIPQGAPVPTVSLGLVTPGDLLATTATNGIQDYASGVPNGATSTYFKVTGGATTAYMLVGVSGLSAGKFDVFIEYMLGN